MADTYDLALVQGETFTRVLSITEDSDPFDFTAYTVVAQIRDRESTSGTLLLDLAAYITKAVDGLSFTIRIPANVTSELDARRFGPSAAWDCFALADGDPTNAALLLQGRATIDPATTDTVTP